MIGQHSEVGAAVKGLSNVAKVRKPLHRSRGSAILSVPGQPKKSWFTPQVRDEELQLSDELLTNGGLTLPANADAHAQPPSGIRVGCARLKRQPPGL